MKVHESIDGRLRSFIEKQHVFFVATAPLAGDGHVNLSPKGLDGTFTVLDEHSVAYLDLTGSGAETIAHVRENGRVTLMFCAFDSPPNIVRLHGRGRHLVPADDEFDSLRARFVDLPGVRGIVVVDVDRVSDSCGYAVPLMSFEGDRDLLTSWAANRGPQGIAKYQRDKNASSIDDLPALEQTTEPTDDPR